MPNWLFGLVTVVTFYAFGITGLAATRKWAPSLHHATLSHNDIVGYYFSAITVLYGITLGLLMVGVWSTFSQTAEKVDREADSLAALYMDVSQYPDPGRRVLQGDLRTYTRQVIDLAWPQQQNGIIPKADEAVIAEIANDLATFEPASEAQKVLHAECYKQFNELVQRRRSRVLSVTAGLSGALWSLLLVGAVITIAVTWCFHLHNEKMHLLMTALTSSLLGLMIFLVAAMDHPFLGKISVSPEPFKVVYDQLMGPEVRPPHRNPLPSQTP